MNDARKAPNIPTSLLRRIVESEAGLAILTDNRGRDWHEGHMLAEAGYAKWMGWHEGGKVIRATTAGCQLIDK